MADIIPVLDSTSLQDDTFYTSIIKDNLEQRILVLNEEITSDLIERFVLFILKWNREDKGRASKDRQPIRLYINSDGGDVMVALNLIDVILASKTPVYAIGLGTIASAAYYIYLAGHKRFAFRNSAFLQHDGGMTISNSNSKAKDTMRFFDNVDARIKEYVLKVTSMTDEWYEDHYTQEYWMFADEAQSLGIVDKIATTLDEVF